jgi:hypothetical protein
MLGDIMKNQIKKDIILKNIENIRIIKIYKKDIDFIDFNITINNIKVIDIELLNVYNRFMFYNNQYSFNSLLDNINDIDFMDNTLFIQI